VVALVLTACGQGLATETNDPAPGEVLLVQTNDGLEAVSTAAGSAATTFPGGILSPRSDVLVSTEQSGNSTTLRRFDLTGKELGHAQVSGVVAARVISPSGRLVAATESEVAGASPYVPVGRSRTRVAVADAAGRVREYDLRGNFEPEAFSTDDGQLFMLEYIPALAPTRYRVRRLFLHNGLVRRIGRLKTAAPNQMQGTGRTQVYSPYGNELYTLYTQQEHAGHEEEVIQGENAFVHLLNLDDGWTHCIDLPSSFGSGRATASAIAITPDGSHLFVVDWTNGVVADAEPAKQKVTRSESIDFGSPDEQTFARANATRLYVAGGSEIVIVDSGDLSEIDRWSMDEEITGFTMNDDGNRLYVAVAGRVDVIDTATGAVVRTVETPGVLGLAHVEPPA
jgi:hypothetical protein